MGEVNQRTLFRMLVLIAVCGMTRKRTELGELRYIKNIYMFESGGGKGEASDASTSRNSRSAQGGSLESSPSTSKTFPPRAKIHIR